MRGGTNHKTHVLSQLIRDLQLTPHIIPSSAFAKNRYIYHNHKLHDAKQLALSLVGRSFVMGMPFKQLYYFLTHNKKHSSADESVHAFFHRNFGEGLCNILVRAMVNGVYGGGMERLSMKACSPFNMLKNLEMQYGSCIIGALASRLKARPNSELVSYENDLSGMSSFTFEHGLQQLTDALVNNLSQQENTTLLCSTGIDKATHNAHKQCVELFTDRGSKALEFDHVITAVRPAAAGLFLDAQTMDTHGVRELNGTSSLLTVNVVIKNAGKDVSERFQGFGALIPEDKEHSMLGVIYYSSVFARSASEQKEKDALSLVLMFGGPDYDVNALSAHGVVALCKHKLQVMYDVDVAQCGSGREVVLEDGGCWEEGVEKENALDEADIIFNVNRLDRCIDHYLIGHMEKMSKLREDLAVVYDERVSLIGSGYDGAGIPDSIYSSYSCAQQLSGIDVMRKALK